MDSKKVLELKHDRKILDKDEADVWGWASPAGRIRLNRRAEAINSIIGSCVSLKGTDCIKILELGCGTGILTDNLSYSLKTKIISLDICEGFICKAVNRLKKSGKESIFLTADAEALPFINESFDLVIGVSVLHHLNMDFALREIRRVLKPGGRFIFSEPNMANPQIFIQKNIGFVKRLAGDSPSETAFLSSNVLALFGRYGLKAKVMPFDFLHPATPMFFIPAAQKIGGWLEKNSFLKYIAGSLLIWGEKI